MASEDTNDRLLIFHGGGVGDFLLSLPAVHALAQRFGPRNTTVFCYARMHPLLAWLGIGARPIDGPAVSALFAPGGAGNSGGTAPCAGRVVSWFGAADETFRANLARLAPRVFIFESAPPAGFAGHVCDLRRRQAQTVDPAVEVPGAFLLRPPGPVRPEAAFAVHPGSGGRAKCWPASRFAQTIRAVRKATGLRARVLLGPAEPDLAPAFAGLDGADLLTPATLPEAAGALLACRAYLGNDSGISHLAAALGVPSAVIFGPTSPALWAPPGARVLAGGGTRPGFGIPPEEAARALRELAQTPPETARISACNPLSGLP